MLEIPHDYLWELEASFPHNPFPRLFFTMATTSDANANRKPANVMFWAYRPGSTWNSRCNDLVATGPTHSAPANPEPAFCTNAHWTCLCSAKRRCTCLTPNCGMERHQGDIPSDASQTHDQSLEKVPMTGFENRSVMSTAELTSNCNSTVHHKQQFTLDEATIHARMCHFKDTKCLPASIQGTTSASETNSLFSPWSASDLNDFKAWASSEAATLNMCHMSGAVMTVCPPVAPDTSSKQGTPSTTTASAPSAAGMINNLTTLSQACPCTFSQDPKGHGHILPSMWAAAPWDGTPVDPIGKMKEELCTFLKPAEHSLVIRGIHDLFYQVNPFGDNQNPTVAEIDNWNMEVARHFGRMFGTATPVNLDARLTLEARWASERKHAEDWDVAHPLDCNGTTTKGGPCGPCYDGGTPVDASGGHCGAAFWPSASDRQLATAAPPHLDDTTKCPELSNCNTRNSKAEGASAVGLSAPWSSKLASIITNWICTEGHTGHPGPYVNHATTRERIDFAWWCEDGMTGVAFRGKHS